MHVRAETGDAQLVLSRTFSGRMGQYSNHVEGMHV